MRFVSKGGLSIFSGLFPPLQDTQIHPLPPQLVHQRRALPIRAGAVGHGVEEGAGLIHQVAADGAEAFEFGPAVVEILQEDGDVVVGLRAGVAAGAGAEEDHAFDAVAVGAVERGAELGQDRVGGGRRGVVHGGSVA